MTMNRLGSTPLEKLPRNALGLTRPYGSIERYSLTGFTLLETLIAVTIVTLAVAAPLFTASRSTVAIQLAQNQITASYLAQEGIEYVRRMRDDEFLSAFQAGGANISSVAWSNFLNAGSGASIYWCRTSVAPNGACTLDPFRTMNSGSGFSISYCANGTCPPLYLTNGVYTEQSNGTATPYTRTIQAVDVSSTDEKIISTVTWNFHGTPYAVTVTDHLTPWQ